MRYRGEWRARVEQNLSLRRNALSRSLGLLIRFKLLVAGRGGPAALSLRKTPSSARKSDSEEIALAAAPGPVINRDSPQTRHPAVKRNGSKLHRVGKAAPNSRGPSHWHHDTSLSTAGVRPV